MLKLRLEQNKHALVIVAHPDDETIWMGGTILKNQNTHWTIFSLCRADDTDRAPKFFQVCDFFNARGIMTTLDDEDKLTLKQTLLVIKKLILEQIGKQTFDYIFTHGSNGEYGHERHLGAHQAITELVKKGELITAELLSFNYEMAGSSARMTQAGNHSLKIKTDTDFITELTPDEFQQKKSVMTGIYGFAPDGIDTGYCTNPEGFKKLLISILT